MRRRLLSIGLLAFALGLVPACQSTSSPIQPAETALLPEYIAPDHGLATLGRYDLTIEADTAQITPVRDASATVGQHFNVDVTDAFTRTLCRDCLSVVAVARDADDLLLTLRVKHPLKLANNTLPPGSSNRRDLWLSTVKGILLVDGTASYFGGAVTLNNTLMATPDGYTDILLPRGSGSANTWPYMIFGASGANLGNGNFDAVNGWGAHLDDPTGYTVLANGQQADAVYRLHLSGTGPLYASMVLTAAYSAPTPIAAGRLTPTYFMPGGAAPEAWRVGATAAGPLTASDPDSSTTLTVSVLDWQQAAALQTDPAYPNPSNPKGLAVLSRISRVTLDLPGILPAATDLPITGATGAGLAADPWLLTATVNNELRAPAGTYTGLLKVIDSRDPQSLQTPYGTTTFIGPDLKTPYAGPAEFATYALVWMIIEEATTSSPLDWSPVLQADVRDVTVGPAIFERCSDAPAFNAIWNTYFPEIAAPILDFSTRDAYVITTAQLQGSGGYSHQVESVEYDTATNVITVTAPLWSPLGGCFVIDTLPTRMVTIIQAARPVATSPTIQLIQTAKDLCDAPACTPATPAYLEIGDAGADWMGIGTSLVIETQAGLTAAWEAIHGVGATPPAVNFATDAVAFVTSGHHDDATMWATAYVNTVCTGGPASEIAIDEWEALTCPTSPPGDNSPYCFASFPRVAGLAGYGFTRNIQNICTGGSGCTPEPANVILSGDDPDAEGVRIPPVPITSQAELDTQWGQFFHNPPPKPVVDWSQTDAVFYQDDHHFDGFGQRAIEFTEMCYDPAGSLDLTLNIVAPRTCAANPGPSTAWALVAIPKGTANWVIQYGIVRKDWCQ